jgi:hypothetical protein
MDVGSLLQLGINRLGGVNLAQTLAESAALGNGGIDAPPARCMEAGLH